MCGIAGYFGEGNKDILEKMTDALYYRGPDARDFYVDEKVGLGHRRLAIIDLSPAGNQPLANEEENIYIILNGEIYNFQELKRNLANRHRFKSETDTEVILHLYEEEGVDVFKKIHGMFAVAIYDKKNKKLILARDRLGKKPLYYGLFNNTLIFGSEPKSLLPHPLFKKEIDLESLNKYFFYGYVPTPNSIFKNVYKLAAGTWLEYSGDGIKKGKFWDIDFQCQMPNAKCQIKSQIRNSKLKFDEAMEELDRRLNEATKRRLISDVPLGVFLSGGIDSSTVAYYAQKNSSRKIKTFSIGFKEKSFDESIYARLAAYHLKTEHYEKIFSAADCLDILPAIGEKLDEPLADASILPTFLLARFAKEQVTVALGGDGGDELFCGYDTFLAHKLADYYDKLPKILRHKLIEPFIKKLPTSFGNMSFDFKAKRFIAGFAGEKKYRDARWLAAFNDEERRQLFLPAVNQELRRADVYENIDLYLEDLSGEKKDNEYQFSKDKFNILTKLYLRMYMMDQVLVKVDRASMYNALEVRAPFLDTSVVEFCLALPLDYKFKGMTAKYILKKLVADKLPWQVVERKKKGFGMPVASWLSGPLKSLMLELLVKEKIKKQGLFNFEYIDRIVKEHLAGKKDNRLMIWPLVIFQLWHDKWSK